MSIRDCLLSEHAHFQIIVILVPCTGVPSVPLSPGVPRSPWSPFCPIGPSGPTGPCSPGEPWKRNKTLWWSTQRKGLFALSSTSVAGLPIIVYICIMLENNHYRQNLLHMDNFLYCFFIYINTNHTAFIFNKKLHSNHISHKTYLFMFQKKWIHLKTRAA